MIYVPIAVAAPDRVRIFYRLSDFEYASTGLSLVTILLLGLYVVVPEALRWSVLAPAGPRRRRARPPRHPGAPGSRAALDLLVLAGADVPRRRPSTFALIASGREELVVLVPDHAGERLAGGPVGLDPVPP